MRKISLLFAALMTTATIAWAQVGRKRYILTNRQTGYLILTYRDFGQ